MYYIHTSVKYCYLHVFAGDRFILLTVVHWRFWPLSQCGNKHDVSSRKYFIFLNESVVYFLSAIYVNIFVYILFRSVYNRFMGFVCTNCCCYLWLRCTTFLPVTRNGTVQFCNGETSDYAVHEIKLNVYCHIRILKV